jgi:hypothetical protein
MRPGVYDAAMTAPLVCAWDGVQAVGFCTSCRKAFCLTHQARHDNYGQFLIGGPRWVTYPDICADCLREQEERRETAHRKAVADNQARQAWIASLPPMPPEALLAYVRGQVDADDGVVSFNDESFQLTADPTCVATVLRRLSYPGPFKHKAYLGLPGRRKKRKITGWTVVRSVSFVNQDTRGVSTTGFMLTTDGLVQDVNGDDGVFRNDSPSILFRGHLVTRLLNARELEILREAAGPGESPPSA